MCLIVTGGAGYIGSSMRAGDPAVLIAEKSKSKRVLGWQPTRNLEVMVSDTLASFE